MVLVVVVVPPFLSPSRYIPLTLVIPIALHSIFPLFSSVVSLLFPPSLQYCHYQTVISPIMLSYYPPSLQFYTPPSGISFRFIVHAPGILSFVSTSPKPLHQSSILPHPLLFTQPSFYTSAINLTCVPNLSHTQLLWAGTHSHHPLPLLSYDASSF